MPSWVGLGIGWAAVALRGIPQFMLDDILGSCMLLLPLLDLNLRPFEGWLPFVDKTGPSSSKPPPPLLLSPLLFYVLFRGPSFYLFIS